MAKDYYDILGVSKDASDEDIKRAFRKLAHQHHPDKTGGKDDKFKEINEAYQVLGDAEKRKKYDQFGHAAFTQGGGGAPGGFGGFGGFQQGGINFDFGDIGGIGDIFGDIFGGGGGRRRAETRGRNIEMDLSLSFKEAAFGAEKTIKAYKDIVCDACEGMGAEKGSKIVACADCGGRGQVLRNQRTIFGVVQTAAVCERCGGEGKTAEHRCKRCGGTGTVKGNREISVRVPAGINDGEMLRLTGEGEAGPRGSRAGDLYVTVRVKGDPKFLRDGFDVRSRADISFARAALGGAIGVETLDGEVELKIPAGTQPGQVFRLKGQGVPFLKRTGRGDHFVEVAVRVPDRLTKDQRKFLEEWEE